MTSGIIDLHGTCNDGARSLSIFVGFAAERPRYNNQKATAVASGEFV